MWCMGLVRDTVTPASPSSRQMSRVARGNQQTHPPSCLPSLYICLLPLDVSFVFNNTATNYPPWNNICSPFLQACFLTFCIIQVFCQRERETIPNCKIKNVQIPLNNRCAWWPPVTSEDTSLPSSSRQLTQPERPHFVWWLLLHQTSCRHILVLDSTRRKLQQSHLGWATSLQILPNLGTVCWQNSYLTPFWNGSADESSLTLAPCFLCFMHIICFFRTKPPQDIFWSYLKSNL